MSTHRDGAVVGTGVTTKGQLVPGGPVSMNRFGVDPRYDDVARQVWIGRWDLPVGAELRQPVLNYPAVNIAVEPDAVAAHLPAAGLAERTLSGRGWVAGTMLRPGAGALVVAGDHSELLDTACPFDQGEGLADAIRSSMSGSSPDDVVDAEVVDAFSGWLDGLVDRVDDEARLVNAICDAAEQATDLRTSRDLAERFDMSERSLQRLIRRRVGMGPKWLLQRRRLHDAAARIREQPDRSFADIAAEMDYADQAHFTRDFTAVVGCTPGAYRRTLRG